MGEPTFAIMKGNRSINIRQIDRIYRMCGRFMHSSRRFIDPIPSPRRAAAVIKATRDYIKVRRPKVSMRCIDLARPRLDERTPRTRFLANAQHLKLIASAGVDPLLLVGAYERSINRVKIHPRFSHSEPSFFIMLTLTVIARQPAEAQDLPTVHSAFRGG